MNTRTIFKKWCDGICKSLSVLIVATAAAGAYAENSLTIKLATDQISELRNTSQSIVVAQTVAGSDITVVWAVISPTQLSGTTVLQWNPGQMWVYQSNTSVMSGARIALSMVLPSSLGASYSYNGTGLVQSTSGSGSNSTIKISNDAAGSLTFGLASAISVNGQASSPAAVSANAIRGSASVSLTPENQVSIFTTSGPVAPGQMMAQLVGNVLPVNYSGVSARTLSYNSETNGFVQSQ